MQFIDIEEQEEQDLATISNNTAKHLYLISLNNRNLGHQETFYNFTNQEHFKNISFVLSSLFIAYHLTSNTSKFMNNEISFSHLFKNIFSTLAYFGVAYCGLWLLNTHISEKINNSKQQIEHNKKMFTDKVKQAFKYITQNNTLNNDNKEKIKEQILKYLALSVCEIYNINHDNKHLESFRSKSAYLEQFSYGVLLDIKKILNLSHNELNLTEEEQSYILDIVNTFSEEQIVNFIKDKIIAEEQEETKEVRRPSTNYNQSLSRSDHNYSLVSQNDNVSQEEKQRNDYMRSFNPSFKSNNEITRDRVLKQRRIEDELQLRQLIDRGPVPFNNNFILQIRENHEKIDTKKTFEDKLEEGRENNDSTITLY